MIFTVHWAIVNKFIKLMRNREVDIISIVVTRSRRFKLLWISQSLALSFTFVDYSRSMRMAEAPPPPLQIPANPF